MDQQRIKELIELLGESDLSELTLSEGGTTVTLSRHATAPVAPVAPVPRQPAAAAEAAVPGAAHASPAPAPITASAASQVCSPLYGVLHLTPSPEEPPFTAIGASVTAGQILCVVEAMKMFHQVKATKNGRVEAILAQAGDEVESGQPLFSIV